VRSRFFGLKFLRNKHRTEPRIAVIVSKKIFKSAVKRNRIRRRIYEIIRTNFDFSQNYDVALTVFSPEVLTLPQAELLAEMRKLLRGIR
jgi:ribonuclease P protein component